jgi:hypothetical protein
MAEILDNWSMAFTAEPFFWTGEQMIVFCLPKVSTSDSDQIYQIPLAVV